MSEEEPITVPQLDRPAPALDPDYSRAPATQGTMGPERAATPSITVLLMRPIPVPQSGLIAATLDQGRTPAPVSRDILGMDKSALVPE